MLEFLFGLSTDHSNLGKQVNLSNKGVTDDSLDNLIEQLNSQPGVTVLVLASCTNPALRQISTTPNLITPAGVAKLANLKYIRTIDLSGNVIGDEGARLLAGMPLLRYVYVHNCKIGPLGFFEFLNTETLFDLQINGDNWSREKENTTSIEDLKQMAIKIKLAIDPEILSAALSGDKDAALKVYEALNQNYSAGYVMDWSYDYDTPEAVIQDMKRVILSTLLDIWNKVIDRQMNDNKAKTNPAYAQQLQKERTKKELEEKTMKAIESADLVTLSALIPQLSEGVNSYLEYGCHLISYSIESNQPRVTAFLLDHGANLEVHEREKTPLMDAAENGKLEYVKLFLQRGANITGEYYFNAETAFSIAAFKVSIGIVGLLRKVNERQLKTKLPLPLQKESRDLPSEWDVLFNEKIHVTQQRPGYTAYCCEAPLWVKFGEQEKLHYSFTKRLLALLHNISKLAEYQGDVEVSRLLELATIYRLLHDKIAIAKKTTPISLENLYSMLGKEKHYRVLPFKTDGASSRVLTEREIQTHITRLNTALKSQKELDINWREYPQFFIAQYRCVHYYTHFFDRNQLMDHSYTSHLGRMAAAPAVYQMSSLTPIQHQVARESELMKDAVDLRTLFDSFFQSGHVTIYGRSFPSMGHYLQERMSNFYKEYQDDIKARNNAAYEILNDLGAHGYPHYASSDLLDHTLRYGYGLKKVGGLSQHILKPVYNNEGKPTNPILGKIFIGLFRPLEMAALRARHVAGMHNRGEFTLRDQVTPERETSITGGVDAGYIFYEECLEVPDLSQWDEAYTEKYGLSKTTFLQFQRDLKNATNTIQLENIGARIIEYVKNHKEKALLRIAQEEARLRGGHLIYRPNNKVYSLTPEPIRHSERQPYVSQHERELMSGVGRERFYNRPTTTQTTLFSTVSTSSSSSLPTDKKRSGVSAELEGVPPGKKADNKLSEYTDKSETSSSTEAGSGNNKRDAKQIDAESSQNKKAAVSAASSNNDNRTYTSTRVNGQTLHFARERIKSDGNCGLTGLGTDRSTFVETLLNLSNEREAQESLWCEIYEALINTEINSPSNQWQALLDRRYNAQTTIDTYIRALRELTPEAKQFEGSQLEQLIAWLRSKNSTELNGWAEKLTGQKANIDQIERDIKQYCCNKTIFEHYVNSFLSDTKRLFVGHASAMLFANAKNITLYIWEAESENSPQLKLKNQVTSASPANTIHLFHTAGSTHFDLFVETTPVSSSSNPNPFAHFKPKPTQQASSVLTDEQIARNVDITREEEAAKKSSSKM